MEPLISIVSPTMKGPRIEHKFPNIEYKLNADNSFLDFIFFTKKLLLDAWMGPTKKPINNAITQKNIIFLIKKSVKVKINRLNIQAIIVFKDPILSSNFPSIKQPKIPKRFIKTPKNKIWDSDSSKINAAIILANANMEITALLKKK